MANHHLLLARGGGAVNTARSEVAFGRCSDLGQCFRLLAVDASVQAPGADAHLSRSIHESSLLWKARIALISSCMDSDGMEKALQTV